MAVRDIYEDKYSLQYIKEQMENDFPNEILRLECIHKVPKYGNDLDGVDEIAVKVIEFSCKVLDEMEESMDLHSMPSLLFYGW